MWCLPDSPRVAKTRLQPSKRWLASSKPELAESVLDGHVSFFTVHLWIGAVLLPDGHGSTVERDVGQIGRVNQTLVCPFI